VKFPSSVSDFIICMVGPPLDFFFLAELVKAIESVVPDIVDILMDTDFGCRHSALSALEKISEQCK